MIEKLGSRLKADLHTIDPIVFAQESPQEMIKKLGKDKIEQMKIMDRKKDREGFITIETTEAVSLGDGDADWRACAKAAKEIGFEGYVISDTPFNSTALNTNGEDYISLAVKDLETLKKAFA